MNKNSSLLLLALLAVALAASANPTFDDYVRGQGSKFANDAERNYRRGVYEANVRSITDNNNRKDATHQEGVNQFTGLTQAEFQKIALGAIPPATRPVVAAPLVGAWAPVVVDLTAKTNWITGIKNQGCCGSCWAFSAIGAIESLSFIGNNTAKADYSEQQLVDCAASYGNSGCGGGWMTNAFNYVKAKGIATEANYPYLAAYVASTNCKTGTCNTVAAGKQAARISGFTTVAANCASVATALTGRPLSVAVDASKWSPYKSGIFSNCGTAVNHGVLLVGVNTTYWKIKNSWGTSWGESGFIRLSATNGNNTCAVCTYASYPNK